MAAGPTDLPRTVPCIAHLPQAGTITWRVGHQIGQQVKVGMRMEERGNADQGAAAYRRAIDQAGAIEDPAARDQVIALIEALMAGLG